MYGYPMYQGINQAQPNYNMGFNQSQNTQDERIWVQNETSAEAYLLAPGGFARLWDSSKPVFYEKRADATGRPLPMDVYKYEKVTAQSKAPDETKLSYDEINSRFEEINERISALEVKKGAGKNAKSNADDTSV